MFIFAAFSATASTAVFATDLANTIRNTFALAIHTGLSFRAVSAASATPIVTAFLSGTVRGTAVSRTAFDRLAEIVAVSRAEAISAVPTIHRAVAK